MTEDQYNEVIEKLLGMFDELNTTENSAEQLSNIVKKANAMVAISKACLQAEVLKRTTNNIRATLTQNISRIATNIETGEEDGTIVITNNG